MVELLRLRERTCMVLIGIVITARAVGSCSVTEIHKIFAHSGLNQADGIGDPCSLDQMRIHFSIYALKPRPSPASIACLYDRPSHPVAPMAAPAASRIATASCY